MCIRDSLFTYAISLSSQCIQPLSNDPEVITIFDLPGTYKTVSYTHIRAHETVLDIVCRLLIDTKQEQHVNTDILPDQVIAL
mgnify:CR=1 FL=1